MTTTQVSDLLALADRCEAATGPDRRLDYLIMTATVPTGHAYLWDPHDANHRYTASLDAAMTLVPEGLRALIDSDGCHCRITDPHGDSDALPWDGVTGFAVTMPLALTAAALRASARLNGGEGA